KSNMAGNPISISTFTSLSTTALGTPSQTHSPTPAPTPSVQTPNLPSDTGSVLNSTSITNSELHAALPTCIQPSSITPSANHQPTKVSTANDDNGFHPTPVTPNPQSPPQTDSDKQPPPLPVAQREEPQRDSILSEELSQEDSGTEGIWVGFFGRKRIQ